MARTRRNPYVPMAYGIEPLTIGLIVTGVLAAGSAGSKAYHAKQDREAKKKEEKAEKALEKEEKALERAEQSRDITQSKIDSVNSQIDIREGLSQAQIASERQKTRLVDSYRSQVGLVGDDFDAVLNDLYASERANVEATAITALEKEQIELDTKQPPKDNTPMIALFSILGIAAIGGTVYYRKRKK